MIRKDTGDTEDSHQHRSGDQARKASWRKWYHIKVCWTVLVNQVKGRGYRRVSQAEGNSEQRHKVMCFIRGTKNRIVWLKLGGMDMIMA